MEGLVVRPRDCPHIHRMAACILPRHHNGTAIAGVVVRGRVHMAEGLVDQTYRRLVTESWDDDEVVDDADGNGVDHHCKLVAVRSYMHP